MSLGEYPTVVARVVAINDRSQQSSIIALLQEHYSMDAQDALEAVSNLPFKLPAAFFTVQEGRAAVRQLMGLGCEVPLKDLTEPEEEEEEPAVVEQPPQPVVEKTVRPPTTAHAAKPPKAKPKKRKKSHLKLLGAVAVGAVLAIVALWFLNAQQSESPAVVTTKKSSSEESAVFHTPFLKRLSTAIDKKLSQMRPIDEFLKDLSRQLDENQVSKPDRAALSTHYTKQAKKPRKREDANIRTMRSIKMLGIALAINNKNRTAWTQLVDAYQSKGMNFRVKKTQQDMMAQLGESVMVELYGEAVVKELLKP